MDDKDLIEKYLNWEESAIETLLEKHLQSIYNVCFNICLNKQDADDISQEVCYKIIKYLHTFNFKSQFKTWIYKISYNEAISFVQKNKNIYSIEENYDYQEKENSFDKEFISNLVSNEVNKLGQIDRSIIEMFYYEELKITEISEITGLSESNVKVRLHRSRDILKTKLEKYDIQNLL